jgi:hypothetical protein
MLPALLIGGRALLGRCVWNFARMILQASPAASVGPAPPAPPAVRTNSYRHGFPPSLEIVQMIQVIQMMQLLILLLPIGRGPHRYSIGRRTLPYGSTHPLLLPIRHCTELAAHLSQPCRDPRLVHHATARYRHSEPGRRTRG